ncbi:MAG: hypothetical protein WCO75_06880 [Planctomycetota bacterium]
MTKPYHERELAILLDWLDRYPATVAPPNPYNELWWVSGGTYLGSGANPVAALRDYRKAMMSSRRRPKATDATPTTDSTDGAT